MWCTASAPATARMVVQRSVTDNRAMRLSHDNLGAHLRQGRLAPVYLLAGDEDLLVGEAADALRAYFEQQDSRGAGGSSGG